MKKKDQLTNYLKNNIDCVILFVILIAIYAYSGLFCEGDIRDHARIAQRHLQEGQYFSNNFLLYLLANVISFFTGKVILITLAISAILALASTWKYALVRDSFIQQGTSPSYSRFWSCCMVFVFTIPFAYAIHLLNPEVLGKFYQLAPNNWHNSTIIVTIPFALLMYNFALSLLNEYNQKTNVWLSIITIICVLFKPSFFFIFAPTYGLFLVYKYGFNSTLFKSLIPLLLGSLCLGYEYYSIYGKASDGSSVVIDFDVLLCLDFWKQNILTIFTAISLPLLYFFCNIKQCVKDREFYFLLFILIFAFGIYFVCRETGIRATHGNFSWQIEPALWLSYLYVLKNALQQKSKLFLGLLAAHTLSGVVYVILIFITHQTYML